jgi:hypothetical protein
MGVFPPHDNIAMYRPSLGLETNLKLLPALAESNTVGQGRIFGSSDEQPNRGIVKAHAHTALSEARPRIGQLKIIIAVTRSGVYSWPVVGTRYLGFDVIPLSIVRPLSRILTNMDRYLYLFLIVTWLDLFLFSFNLLSLLFHDLLEYQLNFRTFQ